MRNLTDPSCSRQHVEVVAKATTEDNLIHLKKVGVSPRREIVGSHCEGEVQLSERRKDSESVTSNAEDDVKCWWNYVLKIEYFFDPILR